MKAQSQIMEVGIIPKTQVKPELSINEYQSCKHLNQQTNKFYDKFSMMSSSEAFEEMKRKEQEKEKEIGKLKDMVHEMEVTMGLVTPLLCQLANETKTNQFITTGPEGYKTGTILTKDLKKLKED